MNFFKGLNKEQWTALLVTLLSALMLLSGFSGGIAPAADALKPGAEEPYNALKARYVELPDEKFDRYWGKNPFRIESAVKLAVPLLKAPEPREEEMPAPPFRPTPVWEVYNRLPGLKYPTLSPGAPLIAEANLPAAAEVAELCKMEEPVVAPRPDRRAERERDFAVVKPKNGNAFEAIKVEDFGTFYSIVKKGGTQKVRYQAADIASIDQNWTNEEKYKVETAAVKPGAKEIEDRIKLAQKYFALGMIPETKEELKKALEIRKDSLDVILLLGQLAFESSDFELAVATYRAGIEAGAPAGELWAEIGRCIRALSFHEGALVAFEKAVEASPRLHRARTGLARSLIDVGQPQSAVDAATDFFTKLGNAPDTTPAQKAEASLIRGLALLRVGQFDKARADFADVLKVDPANAEALNGNGAALAHQGQFPQAGPEFVKAIRANQYLTEAWTNLASLYLLGGKWAEADQLCAAAAQRDPASVEALLGRGLAQLMAGNKDAPKQFDLAAKMEPGNLQVLMVTGQLLLREGQDEEALTKFVGALRQEFFFLPAYAGAAAAYLRTGRKLAAARDDVSARKADEMRVNAETLLRSIKEFDPSRPGVWTALGCAYAVMQRPEEARNHLRQARTLSAKGVDPLVFYTMGYLDYYYAQGIAAAGRMELARAQFDEAVKLEATATDPFSQRVIADCKTAIEQIDQWGKTSLRLLEEFNGPDAKNIGANWLERESQGIQITRENSKDKGGRAKFAGKQAIRDSALTSLARDIPGEDFYSLEMTFFPEKTEKAEFGLFLLHTHQGDVRSGFGLGIDSAGKLRMNVNTSDLDLSAREISAGWPEVKAVIPNPKEITLRVTLAEGKNRARNFTLWIWDPAKGDWVQAGTPLTVTPPRGTWQIGAWVHSWKDHEVLLYVDNIKVLDQARR